MTSEDFIEIMDELGRRIEGPAQKVYELAIRQVYVELVIALVLFAVCLTLALKLVKPAIKKKREWTTAYQDELKKKGSLYTSRYDYSFFENEPFFAVSAVVSSLLVAFASINLLVALSGALNPGWKALRLILGSIT